MRNAVGFVLAFSGAVLLGLGIVMSLGEEPMTASLVLSFIGGMGIGSGLWLLLRRA